MSPQSRSAELLTTLILTVFRVNNATLIWGDRLVQPFGLTSARWQVMGAIAYAERSQPVSWLARDLGANRQNVQRIVNELVKDRLVGFEENPHHKRAQLVVLTEAGRDAYNNAVRAWYPAADELANDLSPDDLATALRILGRLRDRVTDTNAAEAEERL